MINYFSKVFRPEKIEIGVGSLRICEPTDGRSYGVDIFIDGQPLKNVTSITFEIAVDKPATAKVEFACIQGGE